MDLIGFIARPALAWIFVQGGLDAIRDPEPRAQTAAPLVNKLREAAPDAIRSRIPSDVAVVQVNAGIQVAAGLALAAGVAPRLSATALLASLAPTTVGGHAFWQHDDPTKRGPQRIQFAKNVAIIGGLLLAAARPRPARASAGD